MHKDFALSRKCILLGAKQPGCVVSVLTDKGLPPVFVSVYFSHLRTIYNQCGIYLLIIRYLLSHSVDSLTAKAVRNYEELRSTCQNNIS